MIRFEKVSLNDLNKEIYNEIILPKRATIGSAGYDFFMPNDLVIKPKESVSVHTFIRCKLEAGYVLLIFPRSSLGRKYKLTLDNTVGVIDSDYYYADNEGEIVLFLTNNSDNELILKKGDRIVQGIITKYYITDDDETEGLRHGGFGSTGK